MELLPDERVDDLGRKGYRVIQNPKQFCFGVDSTLLAWYASARPGERVLDLGTGTGIVPILMDARYEGGDFTGLEIQPQMAEMAGRSVKLNGIEERVHIVEGDIKTASSIFARSSFDVITTNPPYMPCHHGLQNPSSGKAIARHEILCTLEDVIREAAALLKPQGRFYMIHRPSRLCEMIGLMKEYKIAPSHLCFVHSQVDKEASMVLVYGRRGGRDMLKVDPPVIIYDAPGEYTEQLKGIYND